MLNIGQNMCCINYACSLMYKATVSFIQKVISIALADLLSQ